jgi:hypothetical protein
LNVACHDGPSCGSGGQKCCASLSGIDAGGAIAAYQDAGIAAFYDGAIPDGGFDASGFDAAAVSLDSGLVMQLMNAKFTTTCQTSCDSTQIQTCDTTADCPSGTYCESLLQGLQEGGFLNNVPSTIATFLSGLGMDKACVTPAGTPVTTPDSSTEDATSDAPTSTPDAETSDAPADVNAQ